MKIFAVIAEFNPFHNGHKYLIDTIKKSCQDAALIVIMSGSFTQRGEAAVFDKWERARLAVLGGADLVIELPAVFAVRSAEGFAGGAVKLLCMLNCIDGLYFGSENDDLAMLKKTAAVLNRNLTGDILRQKLRKGLSYAAAADEILSECTPARTYASLHEPNAILAVEYLKAMKRQNARFHPAVIKRKKARHNNATFTGEFSSASSIRTILEDRSTSLQAIRASVPAECFLYMQKHLKESAAIASTERLSRALAARLRCSSADELRQFAGINSGLEFKMLQSAGKTDGLKTLVTDMKSKHLHYSRLQRSLIQILLNLTERDARFFDNSPAGYIRVLAFNQNGRKILKRINETSQIPVILKTTQFLSQKQLWQKNFSPLQKMLAYDILATDLHALCYDRIKPSGRDFCTSPVYLP